MTKAQWEIIQSVLERQSALTAKERARQLQSAFANDPGLLQAAKRILQLSNENRDPSDCGWEIAGWHVLFSFGAQEIALHENIHHYLAERSDGSSTSLALLHIGSTPLEDAAISALHTEFRALEGLYDNSIGRCLDAGLDAHRRPFLVSEFVAGQPISEVALDMETRPILTLFQSALRSVDYAHQRGAWHGSLDPANILVCAQQEIRLADYANRRLLLPTHNTLDSDQLAVAPFRPFLYLAPEQLRGTPANATSDVYSLGVVLYQLLAGVPPYGQQEESALELAASIWDKQPPKINGLDARLQNILQRALAKESHSRYPSVSAFAEDIGRFLEGRPLSSETVAASPQLRRRAKLTKLLSRAYVPILLFFMLVVAFGAALLSYESSKKGGDSATAQNPATKLATKIVATVTGHESDAPVRSSKKYLDEVYDSRGQRPEVRKELAKSYLLLAEAEMKGFGNPNVDRGMALQASRRAMELSQVDFESNGEEAAAVQYAHSAALLSKLLRENRDFEEATQVTIAWQQRLDGIRSRNPEILKAKANANTSMAEILYATGNAKPALDAARSAMSQMAQAHSADTTNPETTQAYAQTANTVGFQSLAVDNVQDALKAFRVSEKVLRPQVDQARPETAPLIDLAQTLNGLGQALERSSQRAQAMSSYREARQLLLLASRRESNNDEVITALGDNFTQTARYHLASRSFEAAENDADQAITVLRGSVQKLNSNPRNHRQLARALSLKASVLMAQNQRGQASELLHASLAQWNNYSRLSGLLPAEEAEIARLRNLSRS
jgi:serine/threonine protein kinase